MMSWQNISNSNIAISHSVNLEYSSQSEKGDKISYDINITLMDIINTEHINYFIAKPGSYLHGQITGNFHRSCQLIDNHSHWENNP